LELPNHAANGELVIVALDPLVSNQAAIGVAMLADAALLCVRMGKTDSASARRTIELIGRERVLGCVALKDG
jgi:hypothetical protein